jgi:3-oxoadipate enol-lactonase
MAKLDTDVRIIREGSGPALVLLHCLGVDHRFWDFARPLGTDLTLLRYDLPGHGTSPVPQGPYDIEDLADQLAGVLRAAGIGRASIAGISLGGLIAQDLAARYPELVDKLILVDTTPRYTDEMRAMWAERAATARGKGVAAMVDPLLKIWFSDNASAQASQAVAYVREALSRTSGEGYALACEALARADLRDRAARIKARTLVLCGDDDIPSFLDAARWLSANIAGAQLSWIAGARHASVLEKPGFSVEIMRSFLLG